MVALKARYLHSTTNLLLLKICPLTPSFKILLRWNTRELKRGGPSAIATFNNARGDRLPGWAGRTRTGESVRELSDWNRVTTWPERAQAWRRSPFVCKLRDNGGAAAIRKRLRAIPVRDPIHDAVSEGDAIDGLGKTPIIDQVDKPCLTDTGGSAS